MSSKNAWILLLFALILFFVGMLFKSDFKNYHILFFEKDAGKVVERGSHYFNVDGEGEYDLRRAQKYFEKALELDPNIPDAWHQLARIDFLEANFSEALKKINKQIELHEDGLMSSYYIRGLIYGFSGEFEKAEEDFLTFLEWDENNWAAHNDLAWVYFSEGEFEKARDAAEKGLSFNSASPWLLTMYGVSLFNLGENEKAKEVLLKAKEQAGYLSPAHWEYAYPGNNPNIAEQGLSEMRKTIEFNLNLLVNN